jgi:shikimate kinase
MENRIIICGGNGAGKSTLGKKLAQGLGCIFMDIETYYFPPNNTDYNYATAKTREEVRYNKSKFRRSINQSPS